MPKISEITKARKKANMSMAALGRAVGRTATTISRWEAGITPVPFKMAKRLVGVLSNHGLTMHGLGYFL